ncbi:MAG TPA: hypothetical protein VGB38_09255, partial [bacterium]
MTEIDESVKVLIGGNFLYSHTTIIRHWADLGIPLSAHAFVSLNSGKDGSGRNYLRPVAAGGCINAYETYLALQNVTGIEPGIWRYLPLSHQIVFLKTVENLAQNISDAFTNPSQNQSYAAKAAVVLF